MRARILSLAGLCAWTTLAWSFEGDFEPPDFQPGGLDRQFTWKADENVTVEPGGLGYESGALSVPGGEQAVMVRSLMKSTPLQAAIPAFGETFYAAFTVRWKGGEQKGRGIFVCCLARKGNPALLGVSIRPAKRAGIQARMISAEERAEFGEVAANFESGKIYRVVLKYGRSGEIFDSVSVLVNPEDTTEPAEWPSVVHSDAHVPTLDLFRVEGITNNATTEETVEVDNVTVGTSYAEVVGAVAAK